MAKPTAYSNNRSSFYFKDALILVAALCYGAARTLDCGQKVGGTGDNTCPRMVEDDPIWRCLNSILNCSNGLVYHCLRNEQGEWTEVCAKEEMCEKGKEPMVTNAGNIVCRYCHDPERYNPEKNTLSNKLSECQHKKTVCKKETNDRIECEEAYDKNDPNSKFKMNRLCRCSYEENMVPKFYEFGRDTWTCSYPEVMKCLHLPCRMTEDGMKQTRGRDYKCHPVETISPVTSTSANASNKSQTTFRATVEDTNKKTSHIFGPATKAHASVPPSKAITENSDVPHDDSVPYVIVCVCVGAVVALIAVILAVYCHWYCKKHKTPPIPTVVHKTTNIAETVIQIEKGAPTFNIGGNNISDSESPEITPHRPRRLYRPKKGYERATSDDTSYLSDAYDAPLASGEETDGIDDTAIQPRLENEAHSSVEVDIHEQPSEKLNYQIGNECEETGIGRTDMNIVRAHRRSHSQGTNIFNKKTEVSDDPEIKTRSYPSVAALSAENRTEQGAKTSSELGAEGSELSDGIYDDEEETTALISSGTEEQDNGSIKSETEVKMAIN